MAPGRRGVSRMRAAGGDARDSLVVELQMGYSAAELMRTLRRILTDYAWRELGEDSWAMERPDRPGRLSVSFVEQPPRRLGLLDLPVVDVRFRFRDFPPGEDAALLARIKRGLHRGGG